MTVWLSYWEERAVRAEGDCRHFAELLVVCADEHWVAPLPPPDAVLRWYRCYLPRDRSGLPGVWSERAGNAEGDADVLAELLGQCLRRHHSGWEFFREAEAVQLVHRAHRDRRYRPLPAGPTLAGNVTSGGINL